MLSFSAIVFFLLNNAGLPAPLAWTNFIALGEIRNNLSKEDFKRAGLLVLGLLFFGLIHFLQGVQIEYFIQSQLYFIYLLVSMLLVYKFLKRHSGQFERSFQISLYGVICLFVTALLFYNSSYDFIFWKNHDFVGTGNVFKRYQGLSYEPSHLALIVAPLFFYAFLELCKTPTLKAFLLFIGISIPILATVSFGFFGALFFSFITVVFTLYVKHKTMKKVFIAFLVTAMLVFVAIFSFENGIQERFIVIFSGHDSSVNGRFHEAFYLGYKCAEQKSLFFGIGPGQIKVIGEEVIRPFYQPWDPIGYSKEKWPILALPNASAETLAIFGFVGLFLRFGMQFYLFYRTKVYQNYFRFFLFSFLFFYQLMGSFYNSTAELTLWVLCCIPIFKKFDVLSFNGSK